MPKFNKRDFDVAAEYIIDETERRKHARKDLERDWKEIDRQIKMKPDMTAFQHAPNAKDPELSWIPEVELPLQAQTLEVLNADARRMMFPDSGNFYTAHAVVTDEYLRKGEPFDIVAGDENDVPSNIKQDNVDKLVEGFGRHFRTQYPFRDNWDLLNAEAFKYGQFVGRGRAVRKQVFLHTTTGVTRQDQMIPMLVPKSIKNTYLDTSKHLMSNEGIFISGSVIEERWQSHQDLLKAATGKTDPKDPNGGWMPAALKEFDADKEGRVRLLEFEGDMVIPRKTTRNMFLPNISMTVAIGTDRRVVRFRTDMKPSYISHSYHREQVDSPYGSGPLQKGMPIQKAAVNALTLYLAWAHLNVRPPLEYSPDDPFFAGTGGPETFPGAKWETVSGVKVQQIGEGGPLLQAYLNFLQQYSDVTGVNAPRLGAQTVSHTTAFAKDAELQRGFSRTVDYVRSVNQHPMVQWLNMEYRLGLDTMGTETFYIPSYNGGVTVERKHLPDQVEFEVFGAGGPTEEAQKQQQRQQSLQLAIQLEEAKLQLNPDATRLDIEAIQRQILGGQFPDIDEFFTQPPTGVPAGATAGPEIPGDTGGGQSAVLELLETGG